MTRFGRPSRARLKTCDGLEKFSRSPADYIPARADQQLIEDDNERAQWVTNHLAELATEAQTLEARTEWQKKCTAIAVENPPLTDAAAERDRLRAIYNLDGPTRREWDRQLPGLSERYLDEILHCRRLNLAIIAMTSLSYEYLTARGITD